MKSSIKLIISIILDLVGMASYLMPYFGEFSDIIFAPIQMLWIRLAYGTTKGAILGGLEEILPGTDFIPSCTIAHFFSKPQTDSKGYKRSSKSKRLVHPEKKVGEKFKNSPSKR